MAIYTRGGDRGETSLLGGARVPKSDPRVDAYGGVDELNSFLGAARAALGEADPDGIGEALGRLQEECFALGALLAAAPGASAKLPAPYDRGLPADAPARLEREIDAWDAGLEPLKNFILPGGGAAGAALHVARAVSRRAERAAVRLSETEPVPDGVLVYLNRLSTWLFVAARRANKSSGRVETPWLGLAAKKNK
jgi:cob(I)alamin adenosyltransferase